MSDYLTILKDRIYVEDNLNRILFSEIRVGEILSYELIVYFDFIHRNPRNNFFDEFKIWLYGIGFKNCFNKEEKFDFTEKIMWVTSSFHSKMIDLYAPFAELSLKNGCGFKLFHNKQEHKNDGYYFKFGLNSKQFFKWKREYRKTMYQLDQILNELEEKKLLNIAQKKILKASFKIKSQTIIQLQDIFKRNSPSAIITDFDRQQFNSSVIAVANKLNIPTFTLVHGATVPVNNFVPFIADNCLCWGKAQEEQFKPYFNPIQSIYIVGNPKFNKDNIYKRDEVLNKIGSNTSTNIVTFATNGFDKSYKLASLFCEAVKNTQWKPVLKIHQRENKNEYEKLKNVYPELLIIQDELHLDEVFAITDYLLVQNSTVAIEGIMKGIPMSVFNPINADAGICSYILSKSDTLNFTSETNLHEFLTTSNRINIRKIINFDSQQTFIDSYCQFYGTESVRKIINYLEDIIK